MKLARLFQQSSVYLIGDLFRRAVGFLLIPIYTRFLSPNDYGVIELIELFVTLAGICFGIASISDAMVRIYYDYKDEHSRAAVISTAVVGVGAVSLFIVALAWLGAEPLSRAVLESADRAGLVRAAFVAMLFSSIMDVALVYQRIRQRAVFFVVFSLVQVSGTMALNVYLIAFAKMGVWGFVISKLICTGLGAVVLAVIVVRETGWRIERGVARQLAGFATPLILSSVSFFTIHFADRFFLKHYANLTQVGLYALAYKFGFLVTYLVGQPFENVWSVNMYGHVGEPGWKREFARVASYLMFFLVLAAVGLGLFIDQVLRMMADPAYLPAAVVVPVLAFGYAFREVGDFFRGLLFINKRVLLFGRVTLGCAAVNLALNFLLISRWGIAGAAWATLLTWMSYMLACWYLAHREHEVPYPVKSFLVLCGAGTAACAGGSFFRDLGMLQQWGADLLLLGLFVAVVWVAGYFDPREIAAIRGHLAAGRRSVAAVAERLL